MRWSSNRKWGSVLSTVRTTLQLLMAIPLAAQLAPEIQADRFLLQARGVLERGDLSAARSALDKTTALFVSDGLECPAEFSLLKRSSSFGCP